MALRCFAQLKLLTVLTMGARPFRYAGKLTWPPGIPIRRMESCFLTWAVIVTHAATLFSRRLFRFFHFEHALLIVENVAFARERS